MLDDLNELKTFRRILTAGSLSKAAIDLRVSVAVVSKRLATLERRTGVRLIQRTTRALSATEDGARLLVEVERALDALSAGEARLSGGRDEPTGLLRVGAPVALGRRRVAPVLGALAVRHPELSVSLKLEDRLADLVADGLDVAVRIGAPADSSAMMRLLADNRRILVAAPSYLDRRGRPADPAQTGSHAFLRYSDRIEPWRIIGPDGEVAHLLAPSRLHVDSGDAVHDWAVAGHGIMLKSEVDVADDIAAGRLERVLPGWTGNAAPIIALYPSATNLSLKTRVFLDAMVADFAVTMRTPV